MKRPLWILATFSLAAACGGDNNNTPVAANPTVAFGAPSDGQAFTRADDTQAEREGVQIRVELAVENLSGEAEIELRSSAALAPWP